MNPFVKLDISSYFAAEGTHAYVHPSCQHFGVCGGCSLQHVSTETQLQFKQKTLLDLLDQIGKVKPDRLLPPLHAQALGYRRKARLGVKYVIKKNKLLVGFREKSSHYLADLEQCTILHPRIGKKLLHLRQLISSLEQYNTVPQVEVAMGDNDAALVFRNLQPMGATDQQKLVEFGREHFFHIYVQPGPPSSTQKLWPQDEVHRLVYTLPDFALEFLFHPLDFTQINLEMNRLMVNQAITLLDLKKEDTVLDLFCGIGNFTLPIAKQVNHVTGVEGSEDMVERAKQNALHNSITNTQFHAADLIGPVLAAPFLKTNYNKVLLDPPRAGAKEILTQIAQLMAPTMVYVSCNPTTLARDAGELVHQYGYRLTQLGSMNMFPHTSHSETIAVFEK